MNSSRILPRGCDRLAMQTSDARCGSAGSTVSAEVHERLTLGTGAFGSTESEHLERYRYAAQFVGGLEVLDVACGSGYGTRMLAEAGARRVVGVDIAPEAVAFARTQYGGRDSLSYQVGDAQALRDIPDAAFDAVVSFETVEHLCEDGKFVEEIHRVLRPGGIAILSTPDIRPGPVMARLTGRPANGYHVREYTRRSLTRLLAGRFEITELCGQNFVPGFACLFPVAVTLKALGWWLRGFGVRRWTQRLYYEGTGVRVQPFSSQGWAVPRFWIVRCRKQAGAP